MSAPNTCASCRRINADAADPFGPPDLISTLPGGSKERWFFSEARDYAGLAVQALNVCDANSARKYLTLALDAVFRLPRNSSRGCAQHGRQP